MRQRPRTSWPIAKKPYDTRWPRRKSGDVVVIAGKGHEDYQIVGTETRAFSDRDVVRAVLDEAHA